MFHIQMQTYSIFYRKTFRKVSMQHINHLTIIAQKLNLFCFLLLNYLCVDFLFLIRLLYKCLKKLFNQELRRNLRWITMKQRKRCFCIFTIVKALLNFLQIMWNFLVKKLLNGSNNGFRKVNNYQNTLIAFLWEYAKI